MKLTQLVAFLSVLSVLASGTALAQTGVSDDRVALPEGPGSLSGVGENVDIDPNMGLASHSVTIDIPTGRRGLKPPVSLSYSSGGGNDVVGMGWSFKLPAIERLTVRGLPQYAADDEFSVGGGEQLVRIPATDPPQYRARFEGGFVRYTWMNSADLENDYWLAEYPDGTRAWFGANSAGEVVSSARVGGTQGTFRYHLVDFVDLYENAIRYAYAKFGNITLPLQIGWVFDGEDPLYEVTFSYEPRTDKVSDAKAGFEELLEHRLIKVHVFTAGTAIRHYELGYQDYAASGGLSRLESIQMFGLDGGQYPGVHTFGYTQALGGQCTAGLDCEKPQVYGMGLPLGVGLGSGNATLIDINGDGLPDVLDTSLLDQPHRFWLNVPSVSGVHSYDGPHNSAVGNQVGHDLSSAAVQVLDVNGDGFTDLMNAKTGQVLVNRGHGDWEPEILDLWSTGDGGLPSSDFVPSDGELQSVRFMDYNGDKRIDVIKSAGLDAVNVTTIYESTGIGSFALSPDTMDIGVGFEGGALELNDINGDGLLDPMHLKPSELSYRINLGWGQWSPEWISVSGFDFTAQEAKEAELEDLNGDGLADLVIVSGSKVRYWLNRNGGSFDAEQSVVTGPDVIGEIPTKTPDITVLYADMNGNGSSDVVWMTSQGSISYLELFPVRPNLLTRVENGFGKVIDIAYASSIQQMAASPEPWKYALPYPMTLVSQLTESDALTNVAKVTSYSYRNGYYDGDAKDFRGYESVEEHLHGDPAIGQEAGRTFTDFNVGFNAGLPDSYYNGRAMSVEVTSGGDTIHTIEYDYADCDVAGTPTQGSPESAQLLFPVRFICQVSETIEHRERLTDPAEWVTVETRWEYDGYGNQILVRKAGVTAVGAGGCEPCATSEWTGHPCGSLCLGDELYRSTEYATPATNEGRWILRSPIRGRNYGAANPDGTASDAHYSEQLHYYDGSATLGIVTHGAITRTTERVNEAGAVNETVRMDVDAYGNVVTVYPVGQPANSVDGQKEFVYDAQGLRRTRQEFFSEGPDGPYSVRMDTQYGSIWPEITSGNLFQVYKNGAPVGTTGTVSTTLDEFGRPTNLIRSPATVLAPSEEYIYELGNPVSRIVTKAREVLGGAANVGTVSCVDGRGRTYQTKRRITDSSYQVLSYTVYNLQGNPVAIYGAYLSDNDQCDVTPPAGMEPERYQYDALGRTTQTTAPMVSGETSNPVTITEHFPLGRRIYDPEDTDPSSPHVNTPATIRGNGLGFQTHSEQLLTPGGDPLVTEVLYDSLNRLRGIRAPDGTARTQTLTVAGRTIASHDPDRGQSVYEHDAAGNVVRETNSTGTVVRSEYDGQRRLLKQWEESDPTGSLVEYGYDVPPAECAPEDCTNTATHLVSVRAPVGDGTFVTDHLGYNSNRDTSFARRTIHGKSYTLRTVFDHQGLPIADILPSGLTVTRTFDALGRVTSIPGYVDAIEYFDNAALKTIHHVNGTSQTWTLDARDQVAAIDATGPGGAVIHALTYERDRVGAIQTILDSRPDDGAPMAGATFAYDSLYRLVEADLDPTRPTHREVMTYSLDDAGRIVSKVSDKGAASPAHVGAYTYGEGGAGPNAVTTAGALKFTYDAAGRMLTRGEVNYEWDALGRMVRATKNGQELSFFGFDDSLSRVLKREGDFTSLYIADSLELRNGTEVYWVSIGDQRVVRVADPTFAAGVLSDLAPSTGPAAAMLPDPDGTITHADAWLSQALEAGLKTAAAPVTPTPVRALLDAANAILLADGESEVEHLHPVHNSSTGAVTNASGTVQDRTEYYPYGLIRHSTGDESDVGYSGRERDNATDLIYFGARLLDPLTGRWLSPDPEFEVLLGDDVGALGNATAVFGFDLGDPINRRDRDGRFANIIAGAIGGFILGVVHEVAVNKYRPDHAKRSGLNLFAVAVRRGLLGGIMGAVTGGISLIGQAVGVAAKVAVTAGSPAHHDAAGNVGSIVSSLVGLAVSAITLDVSGIVMNGVELAPGVVEAVSSAGTIAWVGGNALVGLARKSDSSPSPISPDLPQDGPGVTNPTAAADSSAQLQSPNQRKQRASRGLTSGRDGPAASAERGRSKTTGNVKKTLAKKSRLSGRRNTLKRQPTVRNLMKPGKKGK